MHSPSRYTVLFSLLFTIHLTYADDTNICGTWLNTGASIKVDSDRTNNVDAGAHEMRFYTARNIGCVQWKNGHSDDEEASICDALKHTMSNHVIPMVHWDGNCKKVSGHPRTLDDSTVENEYQFAFGSVIGSGGVWESIAALKEITPQLCNEFGFERNMNPCPLGDPDKLRRGVSTLVTVARRSNPTPTSTS